MTHCLDICNLSATRGGVPILDGVTLHIPKGCVHAILGPNGSGKSTLLNGLVGHPDYEVHAERAVFNGVDNFLDLSVEERAKLGLFLCFQVPVEIPGLSVLTFLKEAHYATCAANGVAKLEASDFLKYVRQLALQVGLEDAFLKRSLNVGFSGGEKKRFEMLQMLLLRPRLALLDELDSGLDMDALKMIVEHIDCLRQEGMSFLVVSHYRQFLEGIQPDMIHLLNKGSFKMSSPDLTILQVVEDKGYEQALL